MFSIGEFSKITGMTIKTLRFYHERGILIPARVEAGSGYRYYDHRNVETARVIGALREYSFSLEEIAEILKDHRDDADLLEFLEHRKNSIEQRVRRDREILSSINIIIQREQAARTMSSSTTHSIEEKVLPSIRVAGIRMTGRYQEIGSGFSRLGKSLGRHISGTPMCLFYDDQYRDIDADFEPCMPVRQIVESPGIHVRELAGGRCLSLVHQGPYSELSRSYQKLIEHAKSRGLTLRVPSREIYLKGPGMIFKGNPQKYLTEIQILIDDTSAPAESIVRANESTASGN